MNKIAEQLKNLIKVNRKIINQFHKDEADIELLREQFNERGEFTERLTTVSEDVDAAAMNSEEKKTLKRLFERLEQQEKKIQNALNYILKESKERLGDAIKRNKAEKSYQLLQR